MWGGRGSADPGSTVSQAASRQAGLRHGPPGESCLLCARAVMIVPAGVGGLHMRSHIPPHIHHRTVLHILMHTHVCAHTAYSCINTHTRLQQYQSQCLYCMYLQHAHISKHTVHAHRRAHTHRCTHLKSLIFGANCPFKTFSANFKGTEYSPEAMTEVCTQTGMLQPSKGHLSAKCVFV